MRIIAVDWSDKAKGPAESLWRAEVREDLAARAPRTMTWAVPLPAESDIGSSY